MNYQEFKDYLITHLWKQGDSVVIDALDTLIKTANVEVDRVIDVPDRESRITIDANTNPFTLPDDVKRVRALSGTGSLNRENGEMTYVTPGEFANKEAGRGPFPRNAYFTTVNNEVHVTYNIDPNVPVSFNLWYIKKIPDFKTTDESWVAEDFFDVYLYCVLKHSAPFLREDERLAVWDNLYQTAVGTMVSEGEDRRYAGSALKTQFSRNIR